MTHELRRLLEEELAGEAPPPLGDVVRVSVDSGRRVRRRRRLLAGAGGGTAAAVLAVAGVLALGPSATTPTPAASAGPVAAAPSPAPVSVSASVLPGSPAPSSAPASCVLVEPTPGAAEQTTECPDDLRLLDLTLPSAAPGGEFGATTPGSALELLTRLLPRGKTGEFAFSRYPDAFAYVQLYLDRGEGAGMIRLLLGPVETPQCMRGQSCLDIPGLGLLTVERDPTDCTRFYVVTLQRLDGVRVMLEIADCLMWDGRQNPLGAVALTPQEAVTVVLHPVWGPTMPLDLIKAGDLNHGKLPTIVGG